MEKLISKMESLEEELKELHPLRYLEPHRYSVLLVALAEIYNTIMEITPKPISNV